MNNWRKYGLVLVSTGVFITGVLWYERKDMAVRAEDLAELRSAVIERERWGYAHSGTTWSSYTPSIPLSVRVHDIYDEVLLPTRKMALQSDGHIFWLPEDTAIEDGQVIAEYAAQWDTHEEPGNSTIPFTVRTYTLSAPSNAIDHLKLTASILSDNSVDWWPDSGSWLGDPWPGLAPTNFPVAEYWYGTNGVMSCSWGSGSWWKDTVGITNGIPRWSCESIPEFKIGSVAGSGFAVVADNLTKSLVKSNDVGSVTIRSMRDLSEVSYASEIFSVSRTGLTPAHFGATDRGGANTNSIFKVDQPRYTISEGTAVGPFWARPRLPISDDVAFTISKLWGPANLSLYRTTQTNHLSFSIYGGNAGWYMRSATDSDRVHDLMLYSISALGETHYCIAQQNDTIVSGSLPDIVISPASDTLNMGAERSFEARLNRDLFSDPTIDTTIRQRNLNEAHSVLTNLTRSVAFISWSQLSVTNYVRRHWITPHLNYEVGEDISIGDLWSRTEGDLEESTSSTNFVSVHHLWDYSRSARRYEYIRDTVPDEPEINLQRSGSMSISEYYGIGIPYPHPDAYSSGLVAQVQIYVAISADLGPGSGYFSLSDVPSAYDDYSGGLSGSIFAGELIDGFTVLSLYPPLPQGSLVSNTTIPEFELGSSIPPKIKLILVYDEESPTSPVRFDIVPTGTPTLPDSYLYGSGTKDIGNGYTASVSARSAGLNVFVMGVVAVVDWNWDHLNPKKKYEPELHTPLWAIQQKD